MHLDPLFLSFAHSYKAWESANNNPISTYNEREKLFEIYCKARDAYILSIPQREYLN